MEARYSRATIALGLAAMLAAAAFVGCKRQPGTAEAPAGGGIEWTTSLDEGLAKASQTGKPVVVDFYADWCHWCTKLDTDTWPDADVQAEADAFVWVKVNVEADVESARQYEASSLPTIVFLSPSGDEIHRVVGYQAPADFIESLAAARSKA